MSPNSSHGLVLIGLRWANNHVLTTSLLGGDQAHHVGFTSARSSLDMWDRSTSASSARSSLGSALRHPAEAAVRGYGRLLVLAAGSFKNSAGSTPSASASLPTIFRLAWNDPFSNWLRYERLTSAS